MKVLKRMALCLVLVLMVGGSDCKAAPKETKQKKYVLCMDQYGYALDKQSGYIATKGKTTYIPAEYLCKVLGADYTLNKAKNTITIKYGKKSYKVCSGSGKVVVNGKSKKKLQSYMQDRKHLMVELRLCDLMGMKTKVFSPKQAKSKGYSSGVVAINRKGHKANLHKKQIQSEAALLNAAKKSGQIILVDYKGGSNAQVSFHEKNPQGLWKKVYSTAGHVGKQGIGKTKEGQMKTPVGEFSLLKAFGIAENPGAKMSYTKVTQYHYGVDDSKSPYYNTLVDIRELGIKSIKGEQIIRYKKPYQYCIWIDYNPKRVPGKGSVILLHCNGNSNYTAGCVSIPENMMVKFLRRLQPGGKIVIR